jgi:hypothetical protein
MEKRDIFFFGGGAAGAAADVVVEASCPAAATAGVGLTAASPVSFFLFFRGAFFLATDSGLNISGLPTNFTSSSGFCPSGIDGPLDVGCVSAPASSLSLALANAGSAAVRRCTPGAGAVPDFTADDAGPAAPVLLGGGRNEPRLLNLLPPEVFARFAGGCASSVVVSVVGPAAGRFTTILPAPEDRSRSFWNGFFGAAVVVAVGRGCGCGVSLSDSESE